MQSREQRGAGLGWAGLGGARGPTLRLSEGKLLRLDWLPTSVPKFPYGDRKECDGVGEAVGLEDFVLTCRAGPRGLPHSPNVLDSHIVRLFGLLK